MQQPKVNPEVIMHRISINRSEQIFSQDNNQKHLKPFKYIAAQGPSEETSPLFWEMIWQQNVRVIVMLTRVIEGFGFNSVKCAMYWPEVVGGTKRLADMEVQVKVNDVTLSIRHLLLILNVLYQACKKI